MPDDNPLFISEMLGRRYGMKTGGCARVTNRRTGVGIVLPVVVSDRVKGETLYVSFHKSKAQIERGVYINDVTSHEGRCAYSGQTTVKASEILMERVGAPHSEAPSLDTTRMIRRTNALVTPSALPVDTTLIDPKAELPIWKGQASRLYVTDVIQETHDVFTYRFQGNPLVRFVYWPGQFCTLVLNIDGKKVLRSYTISSTPTRPYVLEITVKRVPGGLVSNWLADNLKPGDAIDVAGPKGKFALIPGQIPKKVLFVSGGSGVTPLMSMSRWLYDVSANVDVRFFNAIRSPNDFIFQKELEHLTSSYKMFTPIICAASRESDDAWPGLTGRINREMLEKSVPDFLERHIYMCGPQGFMDAVKNILKETGYDLKNLHTESFGGASPNKPSRSRTASANKPAPPRPPVSTTVPLSAPPTVVEAPTEVFNVTFARSEQQIQSDGDLPLLDLAEENDIDLDYGCRSGTCGDCKVRLLKGEVDQMTDEGLYDDEIEAGYILTCVSHPLSDCTLDA